MTGEHIRAAIFLLKKYSQSLAITDTPSTATETQLKRVAATGEKIFLTDSDRSSQPMSRIKKETIMDATYSMRACPKG